MFSGLEENELDFLVQRTVPRQYASGEIVFSEGEPCSGLYVVESGLAYQGWIPSAWSLLSISALTEMTAVTLFAINLIATFVRPRQPQTRANQVSIST